MDDKDAADVVRLMLTNIPRRRGRNDGDAFT